MVEGFKGNATSVTKINLVGTRNTPYLSCMKKANKHPRSTRTYKTTDAVYKKAMRVAKSRKVKLATMIEGWVSDYSNGMEVLSYEMTYGDIAPLIIKANPKSKKPCTPTGK